MSGINVSEVVGTLIDLSFVVLGLCLLIGLVFGKSTLRTVLISTPAVVGKIFHVLGMIFDVGQPQRRPKRDVRREVVNSRPEVRRTVGSMAPRPAMAVPSWIRDQAKARNVVMGEQLYRCIPCTLEGRQVTEILPVDWDGRPLKPTGEICEGVISDVIREML